MGISLEVALLAIFLLFYDLLTILSDFCAR